MFAKIRFKLHGDLDFPATEEMFKQIWLKRLKEDKGYSETLRNNVKALSAVEITVAGLIESLAGNLELTTDPKALINAFRQNGQGTSEEVRSYIFRKQLESRTIMLDGGHEFNKMLKIIIRGMRDEEEVKHRLLEKFEDGKIKNFEQLRRQVGS